MKIHSKTKRLQSGSELGGTSQTVEINAPDKEFDAWRQ
jgi:hypothetical protein